MKLVAIGAVERRRHKEKEETVTTKLTYFARMAPAATFADQACAEVRRRGIERAKQVCAIQDGAEWIQGFVHGHRHDALRILDFAHAADYVSEIADKVRESGGHLALAQTRGASTSAAPSQPLSQALPADPGAGQLPAEAARTDGLSDLPTAGLADWVWQRWGVGKAATSS